MNDTEQAAQDRAAGSVPHAFRTALFWRWAPAMPKELPSAFVTLLYALSSAADAHGRLRFRDGTVIRIKDIAAACKADEKDVRRYIEAAIGAGVLAVEGERKRGRANLYVLIVSPAPQWDVAVVALMVSRRRPRKPPPWLAEPTTENGGVSPELEGPKNGGHAPELEADPDEKVRGTRPRTSSGDTPPLGSGDTPPNNPGSTHGVSHDGAEVVTQPQVDGPWADDEIPQEEPPHDDDPADEPPADAASADFTTGRCSVCHERMIHRPGRPTVHAHCAKNAAPGAA